MVDACLDGFEEAWDEVLAVGLVEVVLEGVCELLVLVGGEGGDDGAGVGGVECGVAVWDGGWE